MGSCFGIETNWGVIDIGDWGAELVIWMGDQDWGLGLGIGIEDWGLGIGIRHWEL